MKWENAMDLLRQGKQITHYGEEVMYIKDGEIRADHPETGAMDYPVFLDGRDLMSEDWKEWRND